MTDHHWPLTKLTQMTQRTPLPQMTQLSAVWSWLTEGKAKRSSLVRITYLMSVTVWGGKPSLLPQITQLNASYHRCDSDKCQRSCAPPVGELAALSGPYSVLTMSRAPGLHQVAMFVPWVTATLDYVSTRRVRGHRHVRDERVILATTVPIHPHYHL